MGLVIGCTKQKITYAKIEGNALGTTYHIVYSDKIEGLERAVDSILTGFNHALSTYQTNSMITAFNTNSNEIWNNPEDLKFAKNDMILFGRMVQQSKLIWQQTNGAFDPAAASLFEYYNQCKKQGVLMDTVKTKNILLHCGMAKIYIDESGFPSKIDTLTTLNFNAIAKGFFVDILAEYLENEGVENYMVEVGGEVRTKGKNQQQQVWQIGVNRPLVGASATDYFEVIGLETNAMATSGNYQNFYFVDSVLIGHTIDPRTGKPVISDLKSATVVHKSCAVADAYATACMVLGYEKSKQLIEQNNELSAYFIIEKNGKLEGVFVD
ncbi:MAG: FAD:protein FMN transferase [Flavobacteriales bacterium]|nr:FAD:protein FMN transferase [Flavobacteriales bacterium]